MIDNLDAHVGQMVILEGDNNGPIYHGEITKLALDKDAAFVKWEDGVTSLAILDDLENDNA